MNGKILSASLYAECECMHHDEFEKKYNYAAQDYPVVFVKKDNQLEVYLDANEINQCVSMQDLQEKIQTGGAG